MDKVFAVIRREFLERVRTRAFLIGTLLVPLMMFGFGILPSILLRKDSRTRTVVVLDATSDGTGTAVRDALDSLRLNTGDGETRRYALTLLPAGERVDALRDSLITQIGTAPAGSVGLDGFLVVTDSGVATGKVSYYGLNVASIRDMQSLERTLEPVLRERRLQRVGADAATIAASAIQLDIKTSKVTQGKLTGESGESSFMLAYITSFIMYFSLIMYGIQVMGAVLEEKSNRIVEVLVSSITPFQLLLGKVVGVAAAGLLQLGIWGGASFYISSYLARRSGAAAAAAGQAAAEGASQGFSMPNISVELIAVILVFFLLGFLLYSALYAAVGAMCTTQQETQQAAQPVTIILALAFIMVFSMINDPSSTLAKSLSFVPFFAPMVIPVRFALSPLPLSEVLGAALATAAGVVAVVWLAGRIYRVGILSYGKRPTLAEMWRWVRTG